MRLKLPLCLLALIAACERAPLPLDLSGERLMVHSILLAERDVLHVLVERVRPRTITDPHSPEGAVEILPVSAADVRITIDGRTIQLAEAPPDLPPCVSEFPFAVPQPEPIGPGCYAARLPEGVRAGERYGLEVRIGGELVAQGEAVVPAPPALSTPVPGGRYEVMMGPVFDDRPIPGILVRYQLPPEVAGLRPSMRFDSVFVDGARETTATCNYDQFGNPPVRRTAAVDSLVFVPRSLYCLRTPPQGGQQVFLPDSIFAHLSLAGFDETYLGYDEAARQESAELEALQAGVEGALGVFAGAGVALRPVVLLPVEGAPGY